MFSCLVVAYFLAFKLYRGVDGFTTSYSVANSRGSSDRTCEVRRKERLLLWLNKDTNADNSDKDSFRVVNPDNIASLFNNPPPANPVVEETSESTETAVSAEAIDKEDDKDEIDEDDDFMGSVTDDIDEEEEEVAPITMKKEGKQEQEDEFLDDIRSAILTGNGGNSADAAEKAREEEERRQAAIASSMSNEDDDGDESPDSNLEDDDEFGAELRYAQITGKLSKSKVKSVRAALSMTGSSSSTTSSNSPQRVFKYDPKDEFYGDPMRFGAYRRFKEPDSEPNGLMVSKPANEVQTKGGGGTSGKNKKKGGGKDSTTDSFYNAIKNLGSGPVAPGSSQGTGVIEPPPGKKPVTPKKAPMPGKKGKKKVITPNDINGLFAQPPTAEELEELERQRQEDEEEDEEEEDDEDEYDYKEDEKAAELLLGTSPSSATEDSASSTRNSISERKFSPVIGMDEPVPKWLADADKEAKRERKLAGKRRKKKGLTDDWRFWAVCIAGAGFVTAFINVYQQTGGFGSGDMGGRGGDELLI